METVADATAGSTSNGFEIQKKLNYFYNNNKIPHLLFHGTAMYEKERIASQFIHKIYRFDMQQLKFNVLVVNCCGKGIKFIRDEIKTFAKMHMFQNNVSVSFKTILLLNTDFITEDAQSALRRSIELFSYNTRFFILVENKNRLIKPILSRFCEIYVGMEKTFSWPSNSIPALTKLIPLHNWKITPPNAQELMETANKLYETGFSSYDLISFFKSTKVTGFTEEHKILTQFLFYKWKSEYRCEKLFMLTLLDFFLLRSYKDLENMCSI